MRMQTRVGHPVGHPCQCTAAIHVLSGTLFPSWPDVCFRNERRLNANRKLALGSLGAETDQADGAGGADGADGLLLMRKPGNASYRCSLYQFLIYSSFSI